MAGSANSVPANDALLAQNVRSGLGRAEHLNKRSRINVSSCSFVITLHGVVESREERAGIEARVRSVAGVEDVINKLRVGLSPH